MKKEPVSYGAMVLAKLVIDVIKQIGQIFSAHYSLKETRKDIESRLTPFKEEIPIPSKKKEIVEEELPDFQEIFELGNDLVLGIEYLEYSPDEKAVFRIVGSESFSKRYYRKVNTDVYGKYITVDGRKFYMHKARVQSL